MTTTTTIATLIKGDRASLELNYHNHPVLETTTIDFKGSERIVKITMDQEKAKSIIEVLSKYLDVVE